MRGGYGLPRAPQFPWGEGRDSYSPVFSPEADARPLSAHTRLARAAAAAAAVIPSILNLTSSHTRDEVIAGSARHVRGAMIGHRAAAGGGAREVRRDAEWAVVKRLTDTDPVVDQALNDLPVGDGTGAPVLGPALHFRLR